MVFYVKDFSIRRRRKLKIKDLYKLAKSAGKTIVFPEAGYSKRTIEAIKFISKKKIAKVILIGDESALALQDKDLINYQIINPKTFQKTDELSKELYQLRKEKGMTQAEAEKLILDPYYFGTMLVKAGYADGMVSGAEVPTSRAIRPALQLIKAKKKGGVVSSCFLIFGKNDFLKGKSLVVSDAGLLPSPSSDELAQIASQSVETFRMVGLKDPKVAFLSYSTKGSAESETINKVRTAYIKFKKSGVPCDGELQFDAAMVKEVAKKKCPESPLEGDANILIYPDLNTGNIHYKTMQYVGGLHAIGPILQGLKKPINDLSRGASVEDIIAMTAVTALQAMKEEK